MNHDVFISYSSINQQTAFAVCHVLEQHKIKCWIAPRDIPAGKDYGDLIDEAIDTCRVFVIIFSAPASLSPWVRGELNVAFTERKPIIPYRIDETMLKGTMRVMLNQMHWIDAYPDADAKFGELVAAIAGILGRPIPQPAAEAARTSAPVIDPMQVPDDAIEVFSVAGKKGYRVQVSGDVLVSPKYAWAWPFSEGLARVNIGGKYGYIDKTGREITPIHFTSASDFHHGSGRVELKGELFQIDKTGRRKDRPQIDRNDPCPCGSGKKFKNCHGQDF